MLNVVEDGYYIGRNGYPRGYVDRTQVGFTDAAMFYLLPVSGLRINQMDHVCSPRQRTAKQASGFPRLSAQPGDYIAVRYLENGHVTLPENARGKPAGSGNVLVFGTSQSNTTERLQDVLTWASDSEGQARGRLLTVQQFDDGRCYQINGGPISKARQQAFPNPTTNDPTSRMEQWCETAVQLPYDLTIGTTYTIYWVWSWPTRPGTPDVPQGKDEYYTTCSDIDIVAQVVDRNVRAIIQRNPQAKAVDNFQQRAGYRSLKSK
jgi:hypothetical protein